MSNLLAFAVKRILAMIIVLYIIVTVVFVIAHNSPYDPARALLGQKYNKLSGERIRQLWGLDKPMWRQYTDYVGGLLHGDMGYSTEAETLGVPVRDILSSGVPVTLKLGAYALLLSLLVGLPAGLISALRQNTSADYSIQTVMIVFYAVPVFVLIPICQLIFGAKLRWLPVSGWGDPGVLGIKEMVLPVGLYAAGLSGYFAKSFRSFMLEVLRQDYIRTARAKGLPQRIVIYLHAMKNTLLPLASIVGPTVAYLILGAFLIEFFFAIPGIGYLTVTSVEQSDYAVIEGTTLLLAVFVVVVNALTDIFYALIDPRVRL